MNGQGFTSVMCQNESRCVVRRIFTPPALPKIVPPWAAHRTKHVAAEDEGTEILHRPVSEHIVHISCGSTLPAVHGAKALRVKVPLKDLGPTLSERVP